MKRGNGPKGSVRIWKEIHEQLKKKSEDTGISIERLVNDILLIHFEDEFKLTEK